MKLLFARELRRQAPAAAGMFGLAVLLVAVFWAMTLLTDMRRSANMVEAVFLIVAVGGPWLLSVTAVAPDQETGAEAFLATMPVDRRQLALIRVGVALGYSLLVVVASLGLCAVATPLLGFQAASGGSKLGAFATGLLGGGLMFAAGLLATVLFRQTLVAFVFAPALLFVPGGLYLACADELRLPGDLTAALVGFTLPLLLLLSAWRGYRQPSRELGWRRPTRFAAGITATLFAIGAGVTTAVAAVDHLTATQSARSDRFEAPFGRAVVLTVESKARLRWKYRTRHTQVLLHASAPGSPIAMPEGWFPLAFSPDGKTLLMRNPGLDRLGRFDLETRQHTAARAPLLDGPLAERGSIIPRQWGGTYWTAGSPSQRSPILWHADQPWLARASSLIRWDGGDELRAPDGLRVFVAHGQRALLRDAGGEVQLVDLGDRAPAPLAPPAGVRPIEWRLVGLHGEWVTLLGRRADETVALWTRPATGGAWQALDLQLPQADVVYGAGRLRHRDQIFDPPTIHLQVGPRSRFAVVNTSWIPFNESQYTNAPLQTVDLSTGRSRRLTRQPRRLYAHRWLGTGRLLTTWGVWDPAEGTFEGLPASDLRVAAANGYGSPLLDTGSELIFKDRRIDLSQGSSRPFRLRWD